MANYFLRREILGTPVESEEEKLIYSVGLRYGRYNPFSEELDFDPESSVCYENFTDFSSLQRFLKVIQRRESPSKEFPFVELTVRVQSLPLAEYHPIPPSSLHPITEKKKVDGKELEDKIYEYPPGQFIRHPFFCDIIKGYDYEVF